MSNSSIVQNLLEAFQAFEEGKMSSEALCEYFAASIEALEKLPSEKLMGSYDFPHELGISITESEINQSDEPIKLNLKKWRRWLEDLAN